MLPAAVSEIAIILVCALVVFAGVRDLTSLTIPNWLVLSISALFALAASAGVEFPAGVGAHTLTALVTLAVGFSLFAARVLGAGDAKLAAATALWLGPSLILDFVFYTALFGAVLAAVLIVFWRVSLPSQLHAFGWVDRLHTPKTAIPYGVAMAAATVFVILAPHSSPIL